MYSIWWHKEGRKEWYLWVTVVVVDFVSMLQRQGLRDGTTRGVVEVKVVVVCTGGEDWCCGCVCLEAAAMVKLKYFVKKLFYRC